MNVTARDARNLMGLKNRCEYEIQIAALKGMSGFIFTYPRHFKGGVDISNLIDSLIHNGFIVTDEEGTDEDAALGIYWAVD